MCLLNLTNVNLPGEGMKRYFTYGFLLLFCLSYASSALAATEKSIVVASTTQIADFARQVAGDRLIVKSVLAPGADPHTYQPTPDDVQMVLNADICLENGLHLEGKTGCPLSPPMRASQ